MPIFPPASIRGYRVVCEHCGAVFTEYEWQPHRPDCVYESHGGRKQTEQEH